MSNTEIIAVLESLRLPEKPAQSDKPAAEANVAIDMTEIQNDPMLYDDHIPFAIYDSNGETAISRTAKSINEGMLNPYEVNWMQVTLYETNFVRLLLEKVDSDYVKDVAQAIDDEDARHGREDGQYTTISSNFYGTGKGNANYYSYLRDNWSNDGEYVSAVSIAEGILDKRNKAEAYRNKMKQPRQTREKSQFQIDTEKTILHANEQQAEIEKLRKERDEWKAKYEELATKAPEEAFNAQTGLPCFTSRQMGIFLTAVGKITEKDNPPGKTTLGDIVNKIAGYKPSAAKTNMKGAISETDTEAVAHAIESKFPNLAAEVRKV